MAVKLKKKGADEFIRVRGANVHNLKNVNVDIPKRKLVVVTGVSGSGKSSLAFDTIYAEAERRFVESLSSYARQFLGVKDKPDVDSLEGLSPAISIDQKSVAKNPRSTVGTITEIYDYLRILFARIGKPFCPQCGKPVGRQTVDEMLQTVEKLRGSEVMILAPVIRDKKGEHKGVVEEAARAGFLRMRINGAMMTMEEATTLKLDKYKRHTLEVVVDRLSPGPDIERSRIRDSLETALKIGKGLAIATRDRRQETRHQTNGRIGQQNDILFSEHFACTDCGVNLPEIEPRTFSFNSPYGACPVCTGLGSQLEVDPELVIPNKRLSIAEGAIRPWAAASHRVGRQSWYWWILSDVAERRGFSLNTPVQNLSPETIKVLLWGEEGRGRKGDESGEEGGFEGVIPNLKRRWKETDSDFTRAEIEKYMVIKSCPSCGGKRLRPEALAVRIGEESIAAVSDRTVEEALVFFRRMIAAKSDLSASQSKIAAPLVKEVVKRLEFLRDVGLEYLTVSRESTTLSGGEAQRIQLATQIGSRLTGIIYILDEPSIGLHARDHARLVSTLQDLRDLGNTVIVVEHDRQTMARADWIIDLGPGAGRRGGRVVFEGTYARLMKAHTLTGDYLSGRKRIEMKATNAKLKMQNGLLRRSGGYEGREKLPSRIKNYLEIRGASEHNLKNIDVKIPLGMFVCVTGVSGSGKSTLVNDILAKALVARIHGAHAIPGKHRDITGIEQLNKTIVVDQSPIGRTPRSNPATYTGAFGEIRSLFAETPDARARGYGPGRFSFNVKGGRCEACEGQGVKKIEMYFLPDVYVECEECRGSRYNKEALEIVYNGKSIADVLAMSVEEALDFFAPIPRIRSKLETLHDVGLGYVRIGQPSPTLSGGEAQRIKLAAELSRRDTGSTLYILDEPTTGLHFDDIQKLLSVLGALVEKRNTVVVIEHNLDVIRNADWIIDLGPEGGEEGGKLIATGPPGEIMKVKKSYTGQWLAKKGIRL